MSKLTEKIKTIGKAWKNVIIDDKEFHDLYRDRMRVCNDCEYNILKTCSLCGCPLVSKTRSRYVDEDGDITECPASKWLDSFYEIDGSNELYVIKDNLPKNLQQYFEDDYIRREDWIEFLREKDQEE